MTIHFALSSTSGRGACFAPINQITWNASQDAAEVTCKRCRKMLDSHTASLGDINR